VAHGPIDGGKIAKKQNVMRETGLTIRKTCLKLTADKINIRFQVVIVTLDNRFMIAGISTNRNTRGKAPSVLKIGGRDEDKIMTSTVKHPELVNHDPCNAVGFLEVRENT